MAQNLDRKTYFLLTNRGPQGTKNPKESDAVGNLVKEDVIGTVQEKNGGRIAVICGGPMALRSLALGVGKSTWDELKSGGQREVGSPGYFIDKNWITSEGPGTAFDFGLAIVENLIGPEVTPKLKKALALEI